MNEAGMSSVSWARDGSGHARARGARLGAFVAALAIAFTATIRPASAQAPVPNISVSENAALLFLVATDKAWTDIVYYCGVATTVAVGSAAAAAKAATTPAGKIVAGITVIASGAACQYQIEQRKNDIRDAWLKLPTVESRAETLRHLTALGYLDLISTQFPQLFTLGVDTADARKLEALASDLSRSYQLCVRETAPERAASCALIVGNDTPSTSPLRLELAEKIEMFRCMDKLKHDYLNTQEQHRRACSLALEMRRSNGQPLASLPANLASVPRPPEMPLWDSRAFIANPIPSLQQASFVLNRFTFGGDVATKQVRINFMYADGQIIPLTPTRQTFQWQGNRIEIAYYYAQWDTNAVNPYGGYIKVNGARFDFVFQYDDKGNFRVDQHGDWVFVVTTPDGGRYEASFGSGKLEPARLRKLKYAEHDVHLINVSRLFESPERVRLSVGAHSVTLAPGETAVINGQLVTVTRDTQGRPIAMVMTTPRGIETYELGADGKPRSTTLANGTIVYNGSLSTTDGTTLVIVVEQQTNGTVVRTEQTPDGKFVRSTTKDPKSGHTYEDLGHTLIVRDAAGERVNSTQRDPHTGAA
jgi:hypothetical protein